MIKHIKIIFLVFLFSLLLCSTLSAQDNPFAKKKTPAKKTEEKSHTPKFIQKFLVKINRIQRDINEKLTTLGRELKESKSPKILLILILLSFSYGVVHAIGPGHGKVLTFSYFLTKSASIKKGFLLGFMIAFFHAFTALAIVLGIYLLIKGSYMLSVENASRVLRLISYGAITVLGVFLIIKSILELKKKKNEPEEPAAESVRNKNLLPLALAVGLVPCPGAVLILLFAISMEIINIGVVLTAFYSLGMGITISTVGAVTILTRKGVITSLKSHERAQNFIHHGIEFIGAILIFLIGLLLFLSVV